MNNLELIISGNLTGFSRFFVTSGANDLLKDAKIDFDYRNFVSFMEERDITYAVSFAPQAIALSLISRTLDSFRRPGILVVSLLLPRNTKVESINNPQNEKAVWQLLNTINDKFNEKNLHNGMLNQNPIVLMQDYYTDILANYRLTQDYQRGVNLTVDNSAFNKNVGYVKSAEKDIVSYLNTPCRRAYEGYHSIFISPKAPQNIDEPVEELKLYSVYIKNTSQRLSNVTIDSIIQAVFPKRGELDNIPSNIKKLTYRQVLEGQGEPYIDAKITGDAIHLAYHFEKEKKQVAFKIIGESGEIDFSLVTLVVHNDDGTYYTIANNPYIFEGEEIYGGKTLKSGDDKYNFSQPLDLYRIPNGGMVSVKVSPAISHPSYNKVVNATPTPIGGKGSVATASVHSSVKKETFIKKDGIFSKFNAANNKGKTKSPHNIRKVVIPLVALWLVLGGIYAAWTYFGENSEPTNTETTTPNVVNETVGIYISDTSGQQGEVSDNLKKEGYDKLIKNNITFEVSASINDTLVSNTLKAVSSKKDTVLCLMNVKGREEDSLMVKLKVKWNGESEPILETQEKFSLSDLIEGKHTIQLPVAFSDLMFYSKLKKSTYKETSTYNRINTIKDKDEKLYNKMKKEYDSKYDETINTTPHDSDDKTKVLKKNEDEALAVAKSMNKIILTEYEWKKQKENATKWNEILNKINNYKGKDKEKKIKSYKERLEKCKSWNALLSVVF